MPAASSAAPTGVTENIDQVSICCSGSKVLLELISRSFSRISGLEPTMVSVPPRIAQKPIGISRRDIGNPVRAEMRPTTGRNSAAAPTFCMKPEITPTEPAMAGTMRRSECPARRRIAAATRLMRPVLSRPAPMIITAMIDTTALLAKPANSSPSCTSGAASPR